MHSALFEFAGLFAREKVEHSEKKYTFKENFQIMFRNKPFRQILVSGILRSPIQLLMLIAMPLITYYYANGDFLNIITDNGLDWYIAVRLVIIAASVFLGQFIAMGITPYLIKKFEKKTLYNFTPLQVRFRLHFFMYSLSFQAETLKRTLYGSFFPAFASCLQVRQWVVLTFFSRL